MKMIFNEKAQFKPKNGMEKRLIRYFNLIQTELGLDDLPEEVSIGFYDYEHMKAAGGGDASTNIEARNPFKVNVTLSSSIEILNDLSHEMIHVKQLAREELIVKKDGFTFHEKDYSDVAISLTKGIMGEQELPWEKEAYIHGPEVAAAVLNKLSDEEIQFLIKDSNIFKLGYDLGRRPS